MQTDVDLLNEPRFGFGAGLQVASFLQALSPRRSNLDIDCRWCAGSPSRSAHRYAILSSSCRWARAPMELTRAPLSCVQNATPRDADRKPSHWPTVDGTIDIISRAHDRFVGAE